MFANIIGDICGTNHTQERGCPSMEHGDTFSGTTVLTTAITYALLNDSDRDYEASANRFVAKYRRRDYSRIFRETGPILPGQPCRPIGCGIATSVEPIGYAFKKYTDTIEEAARCAQKLHATPEGVMAAKVVAGGVFLLRNKKEPVDVVQRLGDMAGFRLDRKPREYFGKLEYSMSPKSAVEAGFSAFLFSQTFDEAIGKGMAMDPGYDIVASIAATLAGAHEGIPYQWSDESLKLLPEDLTKHVYDFMETRRYHGYIPKVDPAVIMDYSCVHKPASVAEGEVQSKSQISTDGGETKEGGG